MKKIKVVAVSCLLAACLVFLNARETTALENGAACDSGAQCDSGYCYPGPHQKRYCVSRDYNCAWPGHHGKMYGQMYISGSYINKCRTNGLDTIKVNNIEHFQIFKSTTEFHVDGSVDVVEFTDDGISFTWTTERRRSVAHFGTGGLSLCDYDMRVLSQIPPYGEDVPHYGFDVEGATDHGIRVWAELRDREPFKGDSFLRLEVAILAVKPEALSQARERGVCR